MNTGLRQIKGTYQFPLIYDSPWVLAYRRPQSIRNRESTHLLNPLSGIIPSHTIVSATFERFTPINADSRPLRTQRHPGKHTATSTGRNDSIQPLSPQLKHLLLQLEA